MDGRIDSIGFFDGLAEEMNGHPERFEPLGDLELDLGVVVRRPGGDRFGVRLRFEGITCAGVAELEPGRETFVDCWLEGDLEAWQAMVDDIVAHGRATGRHTINSATLLGEDIVLRGADPMGVDRFSRFNESLQAFLDGAAARSHQPA